MSTTTHKERPILFSGPMVRALLEGRKSQTRRVLKPQPAYPGIAKWVYELHPFAPTAFKGTPAEGLKIAPERKVWSYEDWCGNLVGTYGDCPYGQPGDRLWVRETWAVSGQYKDGTRYEYRAFPRDGEHFRAVGRWKPSIHMPRCASRITLEITDVRVERLASISEEDALAEGVCHETPFTARETFAKLWDSINSQRGLPWQSDPWVWVLAFRRVST